MYGASTRFSGWAWLVVNKEGKLDVTSTANQDSPWTDRIIPVLLTMFGNVYYLVSKSSPRILSCMVERRELDET